MTRVTAVQGAVAYVALSVVLGPLLAVAPGLTRGGGDYCDAVYRLPNGTWDPAREVEFARMALVQNAGATLLILVGAAVCVTLGYRLAAGSRRAPLVLTALTMVIMVGYVAVVSLAGPGNQGCGPFV